jgi:hypothetical protein
LKRKKRRYALLLKRVSVKFFLFRYKVAFVSVFSLLLSFSDFGSFLSCVVSFRLRLRLRLQVNKELVQLYEEIYRVMFALYDSTKSIQDLSTITPFVRSHLSVLSVALALFSFSFSLYLRDARCKIF